MTNPSPKTTPPTAYVYVDGFNLYYGALQDGRDNLTRKWLNLEALVEKLLKPKKFKVVKIKYFTAKVLSSDHKKILRQELYWRALETTPIVEKFDGLFLMKNVRIPIAPGISVKGKVPEEKGTDVNLATHLVNDAHLGLFDVAAVISNDSDLGEAIRIVTQEIKLPVIGFNPCIGRNQHASGHLAKFLSDQRDIRDGQIVHSQFPITLTDLKGNNFTKPKSW